MLASFATLSPFLPNHEASASMLRFLVLHGPNLNLLGKREQSVYGKVSLKTVNAEIARLAKQEGVRVEIRQSNLEGKLVTWIQEARRRFDAIIINPAAYTHTSVAIRDAIAAAAVPTIEVHLTNIYRREEFRHHSYVAGVAIGQISGFGPTGYLLAIRGAIDHLKTTGAAPAGSVT